MRDTGFNPLQWHDRASTTAGEALLDRVAPTEVDTLFRHRHLHAEVHDENAWAMGGVAGHAGLFSSARDLARFAQMLLNGGRLGPTRILKEQTVRTFTIRQDARSSRALGWDTPAPGSSAGELFSPESFGHTGFTGTSIWVDPVRDLFVVLLTNRVNPTRDNSRIGPLRKAVHDAVQRSAGAGVTIQSAGR
jgi:CubicO group peptidase (beta-lactamase class C family)